MELRESSRDLDAVLERSERSEQVTERSEVACGC